MVLIAVFLLTLLLITKLNLTDMKFKHAGGGKSLHMQIDNSMFLPYFQAKIL